MKRSLHVAFLGNDYLPKSLSDHSNKSSEFLSPKKTASGSYSAQNLDDIEIVSEDGRVSASSRVNFCKLSLNEQKNRYLNQSAKITRLQEKLEMYSKIKGKRKNALLKKAIEKMHRQSFETKDQRHLIENLIKAISKGYLRPNSLGFSQICSIVRNALNLSYEDQRRKVTIGDKSIIISEIEYNKYLDLMLSTNSIGILLGIKQPRLMKPEEQLQNLHNRFSEYLKAENEL